MSELNEDILQAVRKNSTDTKREITALIKELDKLRQQEEQLVQTGKNSGAAYQNLASKIRIAEAALTKNREQLDHNTSALKLNSGSLQQNQALLTTLSAQYDRVAKSKGADSEAAKNLNVLIGTLNNTITDQEKKLNKSREVFDFHGKSVEALTSTFDKFKTEAGDEFAPALQGVTNGFNAMKTGIGVVKTGFKSMGGAIKATGFGLLVLVLKSIYEYLTHNETGMKYFHAGLAAVGVVVEKVRKVFENLGEAIFNTILHPADTIKAVWHDISTFIANQLRPIGKIWQGIINGFKHGDFSEMKQGFNDINKNMSGIAHGIVNTFKKAKDGVIGIAGEVKSAFNTEFSKEIPKNKPKSEQSNEYNINQINKNTSIIKEADDERIASIARMGQKVLEGYAKEVNDTDAHFKELQQKYKANKATVEQLERERIAALAAINQKFRAEDVQKLEAYETELKTMAANAGKSAKELALQQLDDELAAKNKELDKEAAHAQERINALKDKKTTAAAAEIKTEEELMKRIAGVRRSLGNKHTADRQKTSDGFDDKAKEENLQNGVNAARNSGHESAAIKKEIALLDLQKKIAVDAAKAKGEATTKIEEEYAKKKAAAEEQLTYSKIHAGDKYIDAVLKNTKKDSAIYKAAFMAKKATSIADVIMSTKKAIIASFEGYASMPFIGQALAIAQGAFIGVQGAMSIAEIAKQKPGFARGGQYLSDGRGTLLPGYSRTDNTNAYLRSGEAVVVSEAMRNPWARNLVSAINVMHGGRDFSIANPGRGYAIGGIFTDGGNANRYYSQPVHNQQDLANTLAYQMINNFPPIYVDVKDVNNQQNILAQTVNRVNL